MDWSQIVGLYDTLMRIAPSSVVALNRAIAIGQRDGPDAGLAAVESVMAPGHLDRYDSAFAAWADLCWRHSDTTLAINLFEKTQALTVLPAELRFLQKRIDEVSR